MESHATASAWFRTKIQIMILLVLVDLACMGFADHVWDFPGESSEELSVILLNVIQMAVHIFLILMFATLLQHTFLLRFGLISMACREFSPMLCLWVARLGIVLGSRLPRLLLTTSKKTARVHWEDDTAVAMYYVHNLTTIAHHTLMLRAAQKLGKLQYYKPAFYPRERTRKIVQALM